MSDSARTLIAATEPSERKAFNALQLRILLLILLLYVIDGIDTQILGVTVSALANDWNLPLSGFGTAMAAGYAGAAIGALMGGIFGDRFGRKPAALGGTILFAVATIAMGAVNEPQTLAIARFVAGIGLGGCLPPGLALLTETMPVGRRGLAVSLAILCQPLGIALAGLAAATVLPILGWRAFFIIAGSLPLLVGAVLWRALPESPAFMARTPGKEAALQRLLQRLDLDQPEPSAVAAGSESKSSLRVLFGPAQRKKVGIVSTAFFFAYLAMSMVLSWLPALLSHVGFAPQVAGTALSTWSVAGMGGILLAGLLIGKFGADRLTKAYVIGSILALATTALALPKPDTDAAGLVHFYLLIAIAGFMLNGTMTSLFALATASFASHVRSSAIGLAATMGRVGAILGAFAGAQALGVFGTSGFFAMVAVAAALALAVLLTDRTAD